MASRREITEHLNAIDQRIADLIAAVAVVASAVVEVADEAAVDHVADDDELLAIAGRDEPEPLADLKRAELDALALDLGIDAPDTLPNKQAVAAAIEEARS